MNKQQISWMAGMRVSRFLKTAVSLWATGVMAFPVTLLAAGKPTAASPAAPAAAAPQLQHVFPEFAARVVESRTGLSPHIYVILDAHCQPLVQENIHRLLAGLATAGKINLIALEGSSGNIPTAPLALFPDCSEKREMLSAAQTQGCLSGAEYACLEPGPVPVRLLGVEDQALYFSCLRQIPLFVNQSAFTLLAGFEAELEKCGSQLHNPGLSIFLQQRQKWLGGEIDSAAYANYLQAALLGLGAAVPGEPGVSDISTAEVIALYEKGIKQALLNTPAEEQLMYLAEKVGFLRQAFSLALNSSQCRVWMANEASFLVLSDFRLLQNLSLRLNLHNGMSRRDCENLEVYAGRAYKFYAAMQAREQAWVSNLAEALSSQPANGAALVIGGFHQAGVVRLLQARGWAYTVFKPSGNLDLPSEAYLQRLQQAVAGAYQNPQPGPPAMLAVPSLLSPATLKAAVFKLTAWLKAVHPGSLATWAPAAGLSLRTRLVTVLGSFRDRFAVRAGEAAQEMLAEAQPENEEPAEVSLSEPLDLGGRIRAWFNPAQWAHRLFLAENWTSWLAFGVGLLDLHLGGGGVTTTGILSSAVGPANLGLLAGCLGFISWQELSFREAAGQQLFFHRPIFKYFPEAGIVLDELSLEVLEKNDPAFYQRFLRHALAVERADYRWFSRLENLPIFGAYFRRLGIAVFTWLDFNLRLGLLPWFNWQAPLAGEKEPSPPFPTKVFLDAGTRKFAARVWQALPAPEAEAYLKSSQRNLCDGLGIEAAGLGVEKIIVHFTRAVPEELSDKGLSDFPLLLRVLAVLAAVATSDAGSNQAKAAFAPLHQKLVQANGLNNQANDLVRDLSQLGGLMDGLFQRSPREVKLALDLISQLDPAGFRSLLSTLDSSVGSSRIDSSAWEALRADLLRLAEDMGVIYGQDKLIFEVSDPLTMVLPREETGFHIRAFPAVYDFSQEEAVTPQLLDRVAGTNNLHAIMIFGTEQITPATQALLTAEGYRPFPGSSAKLQYFLRGDNVLLEYVQGKNRASLEKPETAVSLLASAAAYLQNGHTALAAKLLRLLLRHRWLTELYSRFFMQRTQGAFGLFRCLVQSSFPGSRLAQLLEASPRELAVLTAAEPQLGELAANLQILSQTRSGPSNYLILQSIRDAARWLRAHEDTLDDAPAAYERRAFACLLLLPFNTGDPTQAKTVAAWGWKTQRGPADPTGLFQGSLRLSFQVAGMYNENLRPWVGAYRLEPPLFRQIDRQSRFLRRAQRWQGASS